MPGNVSDAQPFAAIAEGEVIHFTGTEPFWAGKIAGDRLTWTTPENIEGEVITVTRFAGRGGLSFSGTLDGADLLLAVTPGKCSDGMSDAIYPFVVTVDLGVRQLNGCGWTDSQPYTGME